MQKKKSGAIEHLQYEILAAHSEVVHGVFLRHGGISQGPYESLNVGDNVQDLPENVEENIKRIYDVLGLKHLIFLNQTHGQDFHIIKTTEELSPITMVGDGDILLTNSKNVGLAIRHADCQAAFFFDPKNKAIAAVHAGWRGNVQDVYQVAVRLMKKHFASDPKDLIVTISPSLGPEFSEFKNYKEEWPEEYWAFLDEHNRMPLWEIAKMQLKRQGIEESHTELAQICTYANSKDYFSFRRDKITGRHASIIALL